MGYIIVIARLPGIYGDVNRPCPRATPSDSGRFTAINPWPRAITITIIYTTKNIFQTINQVFLYSPCPNPEGIKDALSYKFRRLTIGQNCCAVCTNEGQGLGAIEMHSRARASDASAARFDRPARQATEPRAKREAISALCHGLVVDSTFERSENFAITR